MQRLLLGILVVMVAGFHNARAQIFVQPEWVYHAPPRAVPVPRVDPTLKRDFLLLFHRDSNGTEESSASNRPPPIDPAIISQINDLCGKSALFYSFSPRHLQAIRMLQEAFMKERTATDIYFVAKEELSRHEINSRVWYYALLATFLARPDLNGYSLAFPIDATPDLYVPWTIIRQAIKGSSRKLPPRIVDRCTNSFGLITTDIRYPEQKISLKPAMLSKQQQQQQFRQKSKCFIYDGTGGATSDAENRLWYFREDMQLNQHHWYWHQYFPQTNTRHPDRRGEMFYYFHHNIIARYNTERIANGLDKEKGIDMRLGGNLGPGYNSDLTDRQSGRFWTPRSDNVLLTDILHGADPDFGLDIKVADIQSIYQTMANHISQGYLFANKSIMNNQKPMVYAQDIKNQKGMNDLGNTVEAGDAQINIYPDLYHAFGVHNLGHIVLGLSMDSDYKCKRPTGVLADSSTTMRDMTFYKIHSWVDDLFEHYKRTLPPYQIYSGEWKLHWDGVTLQSVEILQGERSNHIQTFWKVHNFPLEEGVDGSIHDGDVNAQVCHQHLNHLPFVYRLVVDVDSCWRSASNKGTVRLFMAPRFDVNGRRFTMAEERRLMFQLDVFQVELREGRNIISRNSIDSSLTRPWSRSLEEMIRDPENGGRTEYCGCGWPRHLLLPKGTTKGMQFDLFAMVTNFDEDRVQDTPEDLNIPEPCNSPYIFCGVPYRKYPDARPMGYPFDRQSYSVNDGGVDRPVGWLEEYVANVPSMASTVVVIEHLNRILPQ